MRLRPKPFRTLANGGSEPAEVEGVDCSQSNFLLGGVPLPITTTDWVASYEPVFGSPEEAPQWVDDCEALALLTRRLGR